MSGRGLRLKSLTDLKKKSGSSKVRLDPPLESDIQIQVMQWASVQRYKGRPLEYYLHHSPNGGKRNVREACCFRSMGVKRGYPDIIMDIARGGYHGLRIELKRTKNEQLTEHQEERLEVLREEGYFAVACKGFEETIDVISRYLKLSE